MNRFFILLSLLLAAPSAFAQDYYAQQSYQAPSAAPVQQVTDNAYAGQPVYTPQDYIAQPQQQPAPSPRTPLPSDYGQSVMTDIRQMNF